MLMTNNLLTSAMGSHHRQVAILVPDDKLDCFGILRKTFGSDKNGLAFYPGPALPPRADGSPLNPQSLSLTVNPASQDATSGGCTA